MINIGYKRNDINTRISLLNSCKRSKSFNKITLKDIPIQDGTVYNISYSQEQRVNDGDNVKRYINRIERLCDIPFMGVLTLPEYRSICTYDEPFSYLSDTGHYGILGKLWNAEEFFNSALKTGKCICCACNEKIGGDDIDSIFYYSTKGAVVSSAHSRHKIFAEALCNRCKNVFDTSHLKTGSNWDTKYNFDISSQEALVCEILENTKEI